VQLAWTLAQRSVSEFRDDNCGALAAAVAFHVLFSIFPLAAVLTGVFGLVAGPSLRDDVVRAIIENAPLSQSGDAELRRLVHGATGSLSAVGFAGIAGLLWSASGMMAALRLALNEAWDVERPRPWLKGKLLDVALVAGVGVVGLATLGLTIAVRVAGGGGSGAFRLGSGWVGVLLGVVVPLAAAFAAVLFLYRVVPAAPVAVRSIWPAALLVAGFFVLAENLFAIYVGHFGHYDAVYGSLGAVVAFMFFVFLNVLVFLLGAELGSEWARLGPPEEEPGEAEPFTARVRGFLRGLWESPQDRSTGRTPG
jgi:membrane protein